MGKEITGLRYEYHPRGEVPIGHGRKLLTRRVDNTDGVTSSLGATGAFSPCTSISLRPRCMQRIAQQHLPPKTYDTAHVTRVHKASAFACLAREGVFEAFGDAFEGRDVVARLLDVKRGVGFGLAF